MLLRLDQSVQELSAISSQSCQASDCHCRKMLHRLDQICELQWQSEERQIWLPMAGGSCTGWSNLRSIGPIYEVYRYIIATKVNNRPLFLIPYGPDTLDTEDKATYTRYGHYLNFLPPNFSVQKPDIFELNGIVVTYMRYILASGCLR